MQTSPTFPSWRRCTFDGGRTLPELEVVSYGAGMSWFLPTPLLLFAGVVAMWSLAAVMRRPTPATRPFAEALGTTLAVIGIVWAAWIARWLIEQH